MHAHVLTVATSPPALSGFTAVTSMLLIKTHKQIFTFMSLIHHVKLKGFFFSTFKVVSGLFFLFFLVPKASYPLQSLFQTRPQTGGDSRCVFEESENMILQVSTLNFFLMMLFASRGFPAPSASQWKKRGKCL